MLSPSRYKYRKSQRGVVSGKTKGGAGVCFGEYGLCALGTAFVTSKQIESARIVITRQMGRQGRLWIKIFPHKPFTKRPAETRMGQGKGDVDHYFAVVQPGRILFEVAGVSQSLAEKALLKAGNKLQVAVSVIKRGDFS